MTEEPPFPDVAGTPKGPLDAAAWDARWQTGETGWDHGEPAPPLRAALGGRLVAPPGRALVPGCGAGHDARLLARAGFDVTGLDISPTALERAKALAEQENVSVEYRLANLLSPAEPLVDFDLVFEHTCFCAIDPAGRTAYVDAVSRALRDGGRLLGVFFLFEGEEGPPFGATEEEIRHRFGRHFDIDRAFTPKDSWESRGDKERVFLMTRRVRGAGAT